MKIQATRPIQIDRRDAKESVNRLIRFLMSGYWGNNPDEPLRNSFGLADHVTIRDVNGNEMDVQVQYRSKDTKSPDMVLGGGSGKTTVGRRPALIVLLNGFYSSSVFTTTTSGERFRDEVLSVLMHELTHNADVYAKPSGPTHHRVLTEDELDLQKYYNTPSEVRAYMREVFEEVYRHLPLFLKHFGPNDAVTRLLKLSPTWQRIEPYLTEENKHLLLKGVYQAIQDYRAEREMKKAASEILHVAKELVGMVSDDEL